MLWLESLPTAFAASFSPTSLVIVAWLLSLSRPLRLSVVFLASAATVVLVVGFAFVAVLASTGLDQKSRHPTVPPAVDLGLGLLAILFAVVLRRRRPRPPKAHHYEPKVITVILLGLALGSPSPLYLLSLHSVSQEHHPYAIRALQVIILAAIVLLMVEIPILTYRFAPERTSDALARTNAWLSRHGKMIGVVATAGIGVYFTVKGIVGLV